MIAKKNTKPSAPQIAVCYGRQSKTDADDVAAGESLSSETQMARAAAYAAAYGYEFLDTLSRECVDLDVSGRARALDRKRGTATWQKRPGLSRLYQLAQEGAYQHLICYELSRLGRDAAELHQIRQAFDDIHVVLHFVSEGIRSDTDVGEMVFGMMASVYNMEAKNLSRRLRDNHRTRILEANKSGNGLHHGRVPGWIDVVAPLGTPVHERYVLHTVHAAIARELVALRVSGLAYNVIAARLNDEKQDGGPRQTPRGKKWNAGLIYDFLVSDNRLLMRGYSIYGAKRDPGDPLRIVTPNVFPPLLSDEEAAALDTVQNTLAARGLAYGRDITTRPLVQKTEALVSGLARCAFCDSPLVNQTSDRYRQYQCKDALSSGVVHVTRRENSKTMSLGAGRLEDAVLYALAHLARRFGKLLTTAPKADKAKKASPKPRRSVTEINNLIDGLTDALLEKRLMQGDYERKYNALTAEREAVARWEEAQTAQTEQGRAMAMLATMPTLSGDAMDVATLRLVLRLLVRRIEAPIFLPGVKTQKNSKEETGHVRLYLKQPLPDGTVSILSGMYRELYKGERRLIFESGTTHSP